MVFPIGPQGFSTQQTAAVADKAGGKGDFAPVIALLPRQASTALLQQLAGQTTAARILSLGPGNTAQIEVRGNPIEVKLKNLPAGQAAGDTLLLNFRFEDDSLDPRPLSVGGQAVSRGLFERTQDTGAVSALASAMAEAAETGSSADRLSSAGRLLGNLARIEAQLDAPFTIEVADSSQTLDKELSAEARTSGAGASSASALATDKAIAQFAAKAINDMMKAIESSGLFYEAHLQEWSEGNRSTEALESEPQAQWGEDDSIGEDRPVDAGKPKDAHKHVANQLSQLDRPLIHLGLPGFFGDRVNLTIEPDAEQQRREPKAQPVWYATVKMELANLGPIDFRLTMTQDQCNIHVRTNPLAQDIVTASLPELNDSMAAAGLKLTAQTSRRGADDGQP